MGNFTLSDRMKNYEAASNYVLPTNLPIVVRIDGNAFHTVTKKLDKPFDKDFRNAMEYVTKKLCSEVTNCTYGYCESDEISLIINSYFESMYFGNRVEKLCSILASKATIYFNNYILDLLQNIDDPKRLDVFRHIKELNPIFDCRCFVVPLDDIPNYILYRVRDSYRNCVNSYSQANFGHKQIQGISQGELIEMLNDKGVNWDKVDKKEKYGIEVVKVSVDDYKTEWVVQPARKLDGTFYDYYYSYFTTGSVVTGF